MKSFKELLQESFTTKDYTTWAKNAKSRGLKVTSSTHPKTGAVPGSYFVAKDKEGNEKGHFDKGTGKGVLEESVLSEAKKLACLGCDEVSTEQAWKKNSGTCPKCKKSTKGVAESLELQESFKKGAKVKIKNVKSYDALAKSDSGVVIGMKDKNTVMIQVGKGQINADVKDVILESEQLDEEFKKGDRVREPKWSNSSLKKERYGVIVKKGNNHMYFVKFDDEKSPIVVHVSGLRPLEESTKLDEAFMRLPGHVIGNELYSVKGMLDSFYSTQINGDDFNEKNFNNIIKALQNIKREAKKFNKEEDVPTSYKYKDK